MSKDKFVSIYEHFIVRPGAENLLNYIESTDFFTAPASTKFHGAHEGGLCEHSVNVFNELVRLLKAYPEVKVSGETAAIVSLLHDLCKADCYKTEMRNRKNEDGRWVQVPFYTFKEDFCYGGHGAKSVYLIQKHMALTDEEATAINCHMGPWDRSPNDYSVGNAFEQCPLAWLVHVADESATYMIESQNSITGGSNNE